MSAPEKRARLLELIQAWGEQQFQDGRQHPAWRWLYTGGTAQAWDNLTAFVDELLPDVAPGSADRLRRARASFRAYGTDLARECYIRALEQRVRDLEGGRG